jgi:hypothetical protein
VNNCAAGENLAAGSGDCPTNGHSVLGRKIGTKRLIQRGLGSQSPWDRSP